MSAITTTPAPSIGRKPLIIGAAVLGVVTIAAVTVPNIHLSGTTAVPTVVQVQAPDALDRRDAMLAAAAAESSRRTENLLDAQARTVGHHAVVGSPAAALPAHLTGARGSRHRVRRGGHERRARAGRRLPPHLHLEPSDGSAQPAALDRRPGAGSRPAGPLRVRGSGVRRSCVSAHGIAGRRAAHHVRLQRSRADVRHADAAYDGRSLHLTWSDPWVPPVDNPDWTPFIRAHYYGGTVPERIVTRGD